MDKDFFKSQSSIMIAVVLSLVALSAFMVRTEIMTNPLVLILISLFLIYPYRKESKFIRRLLLLASILFVGWLVADLGIALMPFIISFMVAYLFDPFVIYLTKRKIPRWLAAFLIIFGFVGIVSTTAVFVFPSVFSQLDSAISTISQLVSSLSTYLDSEKFYAFFAQFGLPKESVKNVVQEQLIPRLQNIFTFILTALLSLLKSVSGIVSQIVNVILIPILSFYLLKDFPKIQNLINSLLEKNNKKLLHDLQRISRILKIYIGWQVIAAIIVGVSCSVAFSLFGIPYPIVLGILCGLFNPIPYVGFVLSMILSIITILIVNPPDIWGQIIFVLIIINSLHFINTYFLEPNIAGKQVGLHPVLLIGSLYVFGGMFGIVGLLIAVPTTATLIMFFNDWRDKTFETEPEAVINDKEEENTG